MTKRDELVAMMSAGWTPTAAMMAATGWKTKTIHGALSALRKAGLKIERETIGKVTSYRIAPEPLKEVA